MFHSDKSTFLEIVKIEKDTPIQCTGQLRDARANYGMCFNVFINIPGCSLPGCLWSKCMFGSIVDININISGSPTFLEEYIYIG